MNLKIRYIQFIFIIFIFLNIDYVFSIGIAPARSKLDFKIGEQEGSFRIISEDYPIKVLISKEGELSKYIELEKESIIIESTETLVKYKINLPYDLLPGERKADLIILKIPKEKSDEVILATVALSHKIIVNVPYPGIYAEGKLFITNTEVNQPIFFTFVIKNYGKEKINNAKIDLVIKGPTNEELFRTTSEIKTIDANKEENFLLNWQTENSGSYFLEATLNYDDKKLDFSQKFDVGNLDIDIEKIEINNFKIGQIAKLDIYLRNKWNKDVKLEGKAEVFKDNKILSTFSTVPIIIKEKSTEIMNAYWDTSGLSIGEYDLSIKINYEGKTKEKMYSAYISGDSVNFKNFVSGNVIEQKSNMTINILVISVFVLIILNILLIIYVKKRNN